MNQNVSIPADVMLIFEDSQKGVMTFNIDEKIPVECDRLNQDKLTDQKNRKQLEEFISI